VALETYRAAVKRWPKDKITLRNRARVLERSWKDSPDDPPIDRRGADRCLNPAGRSYNGELRNRAENAGF
jgi:hypothetical protein